MTEGPLRRDERDPGAGDLPEHVTMPLLDLVASQSLDADYRATAARRGSRPGRPGRGRRLTMVAIALFGLLLVAAAVQTNRNAGIEASGRASLISQINDRREDLTELQGEIAELRRLNSALESRVSRIAEVERTERNQLRRLQVRTGYVPVHGPGVRIRLDDAPNGDATQQVRDSDLTLLLNGLWRAGAEAIAINGQRMTMLTPIANVGPAIHIDSRPVNPPYTVSAIGDPATLQADFANTSSGIAFLGLAQSLGFEFSMTNAESLTLPAARNPSIRSAESGLSTDRNVTDEEVAS